MTARDFVRFLLRWQHVTPGSKREGRFGVLAVVEQLQGFELAAGAWEQAVLAARVDGYRRDWLDELCLSGQVSWGRLSVRARLRPAERTGPEPGEPRSPDPAQRPDAVPRDPDHAGAPR